jgi:hypothetical protein
VSAKLTCVTEHELTPGLYESLITRSLESQLAAIQNLRTTLGQVDEADQPHVLARHVQTLVERTLRETKDPEKRLALVNGIVEQLQQELDAVAAPTSQLLRVAEPSQPGTTAPEDVRPRTPLSDAALLTNTKGEPNLGAEVRAELDTADEVDLLIAFIKS